jgi:hypothetical protein
MGKNEEVCGTGEGGKSRARGDKGLVFMVILTRLTVLEQLCTCCIFNLHCKYMISKDIDVNIFSIRNQECLVWSTIGSPLWFTNNFQNLLSFSCSAFKLSM